MPELPEVDNVRRGLEAQVKGSVIATAEVLWDNIIADPLPEMFEKQLENQKIERISRRGKFLVFYLTDKTLVSHLRMEGKYQITDHDAPLKKHTHVVFHLKDGRDLRYVDVRKFGKMSLVEKGEEQELPSLKKLGPEPFAETFAVKEMLLKLKRHKKSIKALLLDQSLVAGLGNIYADEVLFQAGIYPGRPAYTLTEEEGKQLHAAILKTMKEAVKAGGTTIRTYENAFGENGGYQDYLLVYGKTGSPCPNCGSPIQKTKVAQRGTHYCEHCQQ